MLKNALFIIMISFSFIPISAVAEEIELGQIKIGKRTAENATQGEDCFLPEDIAGLPASSPEEIIDYSSSIDLRKRANFGLQQDVSLRGSIFEDTSINLQGVKINDPQTGHFNLELPLTSADLAQIEIFKNAQQMNFVAKKPKAHGLVLKTALGQHALSEQLLSFNFPLGDLKNRLSTEHKIAKGTRQDTDFELYNFSFHSLWEDRNKEIEFLFGSTERDFGADSFYSSSFPHEEEHTSQRFSR